MSPIGQIKSVVRDGVAEIEFSHPQGNSLPGALLEELAQTIRRFSNDKGTRVVLLKSAGDRTFCAGASFDELLEIKELGQAQNFFMGFAKVILAMRDCPHWVVGQVQGKTVGGGVGLVAACDFVLAHESASLRLSEYALGFGPFVISAAVQRKVGLSNFSYLTIDSQWRDAAWGKSCGLYTEVYTNQQQLQEESESLCRNLAARNPEATKRLKAILWEDAQDWDALLETRAAHSSELVLTPFVQAEINRAKRKA